MKKLTDIDKLKYWLDAELTYLHLMLAWLAWLVTDSKIFHVALLVYIVISLIYASVRVSYISNNDKDYLKVPKK